MYKRIGLLILYLLLISSALDTSFRAPIENRLTIVIIWLLVLAVTLVAVVRRPSETDNTGNEKFMNKKIGLLIFYVLLIDSAVNASFRAPIENPLMLAVIWLLVLAVIVVFILRRRYRNR